MHYLITIVSEKDRIEMMLKDVSFEVAKEKARRMWGLIENPKAAFIKEVQPSQIAKQVFYYQISQ